ncbi:Z-ring formation inhibitor MciZ [Schinkia sp. CFF1]
MKTYVQNKSFKMVGKAKEIRAMLTQYRQQFETVSELIEKNHNTYTVITTSTNKMPKRMQYYLLIPKNID